MVPSTLQDADGGKATSPPFLCTTPYDIPPKNVAPSRRISAPEHELFKFAMA